MIEYILRALLHKWLKAHTPLLLKGRCPVYFLHIEIGILMSTVESHNESQRELKQVIRV